MCTYYDEDGFNCKLNYEGKPLNVYSLNLRSFPKHAGELITLLSMLNAKFHVIVLTEIGARNYSLVENVMPEYTFYHAKPVNNMFGSVGIYLCDEFMRKYIAAT